MQQISAKKLRILIKEAKVAGKDSAKLEEALKKIKSLTPMKSSIKEKRSGDFCYSSTGPSREEDFE